MQISGVYHGGAFGNAIPGQFEVRLLGRYGHFVRVLQAQFDQSGVVLPYVRRYVQTDTGAVHQSCETVLLQY